MIKNKLISKIIYEEENEYIILDIGANVGDTAAAIRSECNCLIVAIEGNPFFLSYLQKNALKIGNIQIVEIIIGTDSGNEKKYLLKNKAGTVKLIVSNSDLSNTEFSTLKDIITSHNLNKNTIRLIKIDTYGFDCKIILDNKQLLNDILPILYFEYDISFSKTGESQAIDVINYLNSMKYTFIIYDNYGNLFEIIIDEYQYYFEKINRYLKCCFAFGGGIYY